MAEPADRDPLGMVGKLLERKYRVDAWVTEGGFGVVYSGRHIGLARPVAIKVLRCDAGTSAADRGELVGQFLDEARLVARLRHPAVVNVIDAGVAATDAHPEGLPWIAMEWLDGETLADDLARRRARGEGGRTRDETFELLRPVVEALAEAHDAGIVHRDLTPNNLMIVPGKRGSVARVLDFGIAKVMRPDAVEPSGTTTTASAIRAFSVAYAAPEQLSGTRTGPWTDVHALGLLFTEVLCGGRAMPLDDVDACYRAAFAPTRPTPASLGVDAGDWEPVLARALALQPGDRFASAGELLAALDGTASAASGVSRGPLGVATTAPATVRGRPGRRGGMRQIAPRVAAVVAALATLPLAWWQMAAPDDRGAAVPRPAAALVERVAAPCASHAACSRPDAPGLCRPTGCVALGSEDCVALADPRALASDATVWFGVMFPRSGPDAAFGVPNIHAIDLARRDFAQVMGAASDAYDRARPFGLVVCDDARDPRRAAEHLVALGVPAVVGFYKSLPAIELITSLFLPRRILAIAALNTNPLITRIPHPAGVPRMVWRTTYNSAGAAEALSAWIAGSLEPALRAGGRGSRALRVAVIRPSDAAGAALGDAFAAALRFNGKSALDNAGDYRELTVEAEAPAGSPEYAAIRRELLAFEPGVILYAGNAAIVDDVFAPLEAAWPRAVPRPRYASVAALSKELLRFIGASRERRGRFFGVTPVSSTVSNARFVTHYNEVFADKVTRTIDPNSPYDAFYLLAFASYAIPRGEPVTGERLAHAFAKLIPPGHPIDVGISGIFDAYTALARGESIDVTGATGDLDFDLTTGESAFDQAILCAGVDGRGVAADGIESGLVYSAASHTLLGAMHCP